MGILRGGLKAVKDFASFPVTMARMAPTLIGKAGQTAFGLGEELFDLATNFKPDLYTSRSEVDRKKGRELGLTGAELIAYSMQRTLPLLGPIVESVPKTAGRLAETLTGGLYNFGEEGNDYYRALRQGELGNILLEDIGNVMLLGRGAGLGSVAQRAGNRIGAAGAPRLGTTVRRTGYFAEQPIAATTRGLARVGSRVAGAGGSGSLRLGPVGLPQLPVGARPLARRLSTAGQRISVSGMPLRTAAQSAQIGYGNFAQTKANQKLANKNLADQDIARTREAGGEPTDLQLETQRRTTDEFVRWNKWTNNQRELNKFIRPIQRRVENTSRMFSQSFARYHQQGAVPGEAKAWRKQETQLRKTAETQTGEQQQLTLERAERVGVIAAAKEGDAAARFDNPTERADSFGAAVLIASRRIDNFKDQLEAGKTVREIIDTITDEDLAVYVEQQGYEITPGAVQKALAYVDGLADNIDTIAVEQALGLFRNFSDFMTLQRQAGIGMVKGAASPLEAGFMPMPEFIMIELAKSPKKAKQILVILDEAVADVIRLRLEYIGQNSPEVVAQLKLDLDKPAGLFEKFAKNPDKAGPLYEIAGEAVNLALDVIRADPNLSSFLENPMIYPATSRPFIGDRRAIIRTAAGEDVRALVANLKEFNDASPGLLPKGLIDRIGKAVEMAADPTKPFDKKSYPQIQKLINDLLRNIDKQKASLEADIGRRLDRTDARYARLDDISAVARNAYDMIQTIIDQPELFGDQPKLARAKESRVIADEAGAKLEAMGEIPKLDPVRIRSEVLKESETLTIERADIEAKLSEVDKDLSKAQSELQAAESLTPDDISRLEGERDIALEIEKEVQAPPVTEAQALLERERRLKEMKREEASYLNFFKDFGSFMRRSLDEDTQGAIQRGLKGSDTKRVYNAFVRKFVKPKPPPGYNPAVQVGESPFTNTTADAFGSYAIELLFNDDVTAQTLSSGTGTRKTPADAITELATRFQIYYELRKARMDLSTKTNVDDIRQEMQEALDLEIDRYRQEQYQDLGLLDESGFTMDAQRYNQTIDGAKNLDVLRLRLELLQRQSRDITSRINEIDRKIEGNVRDLDTIGLMGERSRLRSEQQRATTEATTLEAESLKTQQATERARLKGTGRIVDGEPQLQKQFLDKIDPETERLMVQQEADAAKIKKLREEELVTSGSLVDAQTIPEAGGRADAERARPLLAERLRDTPGERPMYIPTGAARTTQLRSSVSKTLRSENLAPESIGGVEKVRTGRTMAMTAGQMSARVREILQTFGRNVVIDSIINNKQFVSTIAEKIPQEVRDGFMQQASITVTNRRRIGLDTESFNDLVMQEYNKLLFEQLTRQGLDPISPVEMPDPNDIYAGREALGALDQIVNANDLTNDTLVMSAGMRSGLASQFEAKDISRGPRWLSSTFEFVRNKTGSWKSIVLPFSVRWQVGDAMSNVLNAWIRGDIPPAELYRQMQATLERFNDQSGATKRDVMYGESLAGYPTNPVSFVLEAMGLQGSGLKQADVFSATQGTLIGAPQSRRSKIFPETRRKSFAFNEFQNRLLRHSVATKKLIDILDEQGRSIDEINMTSVMSDPVLREAVERAVDTANDMLGNFSELTPYERQTVRAIYPFWSWIKFINKAAAELLINQPDRVLFMSHLGALTMEENAEGMWEWLEGQANIPGAGYMDLSFINPYADAVLFTKNPVAGFLEQATNVSPVLNSPLTAIGESYYGMKGSRLPLVPTLSRPGYLEGRPGETTRSFGDTLGGIGYKLLKDFGGPTRNILEILPSRIPVIAPKGRLRGTDVMVGPGTRYGQGSSRTEGQFGRQRLTPNRARLSALLRTFGIPGPSISSDVAESIAGQNVESARRALLRRQRQRRLARR